MAAKKAVDAPTIVITNKAVGLYSNIGEHLNSKYIPAVHFCWLFMLITYICFICI